MAITPTGDTVIYKNAQSQQEVAKGVVVLGASGGVTDSTGAVIYPDSMPTIGATYDANDNLLTMTKTDGTHTWVKTWTWDASNRFTSDTAWVRQ